MNKILVSAIITTYGRLYKDILRSIQSVQNQTYENIELILVDDNSADSEYRKDIEDNVNKINEKLRFKINYIKHDINSGAQVARNTGIYYSRGELLAFLDDDDEWFSTKIEKQVNAYNKDDIGLIYCKGYQIDEKTGQKKDYFNVEKFKKEHTFSELICEDLIGTTTQAMISRKAIYSVGNFDIDQPARQDYEMWIRISKKLKCVGVDEYLFNHYIHSGEQISKNVSKAIIGYNNIYIKYYYYYRKNPLARDRYYKLLCACYKKVHMYKKYLWYKFLSYINMPLCMFFRK